MKIRLIYLITAVGITNLCALSSFSFAGENLSQREARELLNEGRIISLSNLKELHEDIIRGKILDIELEEKAGQLIYEFEVLGVDGEVREYYINAATGELLEEKLED